MKFLIYCYIVGTMVPQHVLWLWRVFVVSPFFPSPFVCQCGGVVIRATDGATYLIYLNIILSKGDKLSYVFHILTFHVNALKLGIHVFHQHFKCNIYLSIRDWKLSENSTHKCDPNHTCQVIHARTFNNQLINAKYILVTCTGSLSKANVLCSMIWCKYIVYLEYWNFGLGCIYLQNCFTFVQIGCQHHKSLTNHHAYL